MDQRVKRLLRSLTDTVCTFEVTGNDSQDVELALTHGIFFSDVPQAIKRRYDQILGLRDNNPLVKVKGNMATLEETIWLLRQMDRVYTISIASPTARLKELDLELKFACCNSDLKSMGGTDIVEINQLGKFTSPEEAIIDLTETPLDASHIHLFISLNVKAGSSFRLSFAGRLKDEISPLLAFMQKSTPTFCKSCGAPLHGGKCIYCGAEY